MDDNKNNWLTETEDVEVLDRDYFSGVEIYEDAPTEIPPYVWLILGATTAISIVSILLWKMKSKSLEGTQLAPVQQPIFQPIPYPWPVNSSTLETTNQAILKSLQNEYAARGRRTYMSTFVLPFVGMRNQEPIRIAQAGDRPYEVVIRVLQPPGGFAILSTDPAELVNRFVRTVASAGMVYSTFPLGGLLVIPAGGEQTIRIAPGQILWAMGTVMASGGIPNQSTSTGGVIISVAASD